MLKIDQISADQHVLIAGATASGKSELALRIAESRGGVIVNADALQVFSNWRVLTARPPDSDLARAPHRLYGHIDGTQEYSVGDWLAEVKVLLSGTDRLIIVGGTGLYFAALTEGLADIPAIPGAVREKSTNMIADGMLGKMVEELDADTRARIDVANPRRVQRAWEVLVATGKGLSKWQAETPPPLMPAEKCQTILIDADKDWLNARIAKRFDVMMEQGALEEARANLENWNPAAASAKAIGAKELIAHLQGEIPLSEAVALAKVATRQYAKRQRTWFRARMADWQKSARP